MSRPLPLPNGYFHLDTLAPDHETYYKRRARDQTMSLIRLAHMRNDDYGPVRWKSAGTCKGVQMYEGVPKDSTTTRVNYVCGVASVVASLEEIAAYFDLSTTAKAKRFAREYTDDMLDGHVLHSVVPPTPTNPMHQITIKWTAIETPSPFINNRDFVTLECHDTFTYANGKRGWVRSVHSIDLPGVPELYDAYGLVRGKLDCSGFVFVESDKPRYLEVIHICQVDLQGNIVLPHSLFRLAMKTRIAAVVKINKRLRELRLSQEHLVDECDLVPPHNRTRCAVCVVKFGLMARKHHCRRCGEVVCSKCSAKWTIRRDHGHAQVRICVTCGIATDNRCRHTVSELSRSEPARSFSNRLTSSCISEDYDNSDNNDENDDMFTVRSTDNISRSLRDTPENRCCAPVAAFRRQVALRQISSLLPVEPMDITTPRAAQQPAPWATAIAEGADYSDGNWIEKERDGSPGARLTSDFDGPPSMEAASPELPSTVPSFLPLEDTESLQCHLSMDLSAKSPLRLSLYSFSSESSNQLIEPIASASPPSPPVELPRPKHPSNQSLTDQMLQQLTALIHQQRTLETFLHTNKLEKAHVDQQIQQLQWKLERQQHDAESEGYSSTYQSDVDLEYYQ